MLFCKTIMPPTICLSLQNDKVKRGCNSHKINSFFFSKDNLVTYPVSSSSFKTLAQIVIIMKTCLFKYTENLTTKKGKFSEEKYWYFSYFCSKHRLWVLVRTEAVLMSTHNLCFWAEIRKTRAGVCKTLCPQLPDSNTVWLQHCLAMTVTTVQIYDFNVILSKGNNSKIGDDWDKKKIRITYFFMRNQNMKFQNISIHGSKLMLYTIKQWH